MKTFFNLLTKAAKILIFPIKYGIKWYSGIDQLPRVNQTRISKKAIQVKKVLKKQDNLTIDFPGIYVVKYSKNSIKIGRSKHVLQRLKSYKGYQSHGQDIEHLLLIETKDHKVVERQIHIFAVNLGLQRIGNLEIFKCTDQQLFCQQLIEFIATLGFVKYPYNLQKMAYLDTSMKQTEDNQYLQYKFNYVQRSSLTDLGNVHQQLPPKQ